MIAVQRGTKAHGIRFRLVLAAASLLATLSVLEIGLRALGVDPMSDLRGRILQINHFAVRSSANPARAYELVPGAKGPAHRCFISINSHGMRDKERGMAKADRGHRVLVIGDSVAFGVHVEAEQTFPALLEERCVQQDIRTEVFNMGVIGYDTSQSLAFLEETGLAFDPDVVVLAHCMNDVEDVSVDIALLESLKVSRNPLARLRISEWLQVRRLNFEGSPGDTADAGAIDETPLGDAAVEVDSDQLAACEFIGRGVQSAEGKDADLLRLYSKPGRLSRLRSAFARFATLGRQHDFEAVVMVLPVLREVSLRDEWTAAYGLVEDLARSENLKVIQMAQPLRQRSLRKMRVSLDDYLHLGVEGHVVVADSLFDQMQEQDLLASKK